MSPLTSRHVSDLLARLRLLRAAEAPRVSWSQQFQHRTYGAIGGIVVCLGVPAFAALAVIDVSDRQLPLLNWVILLCGLSVPVFVALWIARLLWTHVRAGVRASNWMARLTDAGVYIQLRSWLNWRLADDAATVVFVPWNAIELVYAVFEEINVVAKVSNRRTFLGFDAIRLHPDVDGAPLARAVWGALHRVHTHPNHPRSGDVWDDVPAFMADSHTIWVARRDRFLLRAMARRVPRGPRESHELNVGTIAPFGGVIADGALSQLLLRGKWNSAQMVAQIRMGLGYDESLRHLRELSASNSAAP